MTERVRIPHDDELRPGTWCLVMHPDGTRGVLHRCPQCKTAAEMLLHSVEPTGEVNNSIACFPHCTYHVWGILDGWTHGKKEAGKSLPQA